MVAPSQKEMHLWMKALRQGEGMHVMHGSVMCSL